MELTSSASAKGGQIPRKHTCEAENVSPPLPWTTSTAKHGRFGADLRRVGCRARHSGALGRAWSMFRRIGYDGPSPPRGPAHRYLFKLPTVNVDLALSAGATKGQVVKAMQGHAQAEVPLVGLYRRLQKPPLLHNCRSASLDRRAT